jgi:UrcA family protein
MNRITHRHPKFRSLPLNLLFVAAAALAPAVGSANESSRDLTGSRFVVVYEDLDIEGTHGADALYDRIRFAARKVCRRSPHERSLDSWTQHRHCYAAAVERALHDVGHPALLRHHGDRVEGSLATTVTPIHPGS